MNRSLKRIPWPNNLVIALTDDLNYFDNVTIPSDFISSVHFAIGTLTDREQRAIYGYYLHKKTYDDLSEEFGVGRERVRQIIAKACSKLRKPVRFKYFKKGITEIMNEQILLSYEKGFAAGLAGEFNQNAGDKIDEVTFAAIDPSVRLYNCIVRNARTKNSIFGVIYALNQPIPLDKFIGISEYDLMQVRNLGKHTLVELEDKLEKYGIVMVDGVFCKKGEIK